MLSYRCDYLDQRTLPQAFLDERAELVHINEQISLLESHISQLTTLRDTLLHRSHQLHNLLSPIRTLPIEIMSHIFLFVVDFHASDFPDDRYEGHIRQAFLLASVSTHFRHIAFGTPELWMRVYLQIRNTKVIVKASSMLLHCIALAPSVDTLITINEVLNEEAARSAFNALLTPDTTQKIKSFGLGFNSHPSSHWLDRFKAFGSPMLDSLHLWMFNSSGPSSLDIGMLTTVTRLSVYTDWENVSIIVPPYLQYLRITDVPGQMLVSLLRQCPNLTECVADFGDENFDVPDVHLPNPLSLPQLKRLSFGAINLLRSEPFVENLQLPSLQHLALGWFPSGAILLSRNVSATIKSLVIDLCDGLYESSFYDGLSQLGQITFPNLEELYLEESITPGGSFTRLMQTLELLENERDSRVPHFPALRCIIVRFRGTMEPRALLDILKRSKCGEAFHYNITAGSPRRTDPQWQPELLGELRSVVGSRRIEVTCAGDKIHPLSG